MQEILPYIALSMGVAWASGINLYAAVLVLGLLGLLPLLNLRLLPAGRPPPAAPLRISASELGEKRR